MCIRDRTNPRPLSPTNPDPPAVGLSSAGKAQVGKLIDAAIDGELGEVEWLIRQGVDVNGQDSSGDTALHGSCYSGSSVKVVEALLAAGADPTIKNNYGDNPMDAAGDDANPDVLPPHLILISYF
eukprot:TRINITY_DN19041_c0_g1_i4.p1 TRINITY_DN19041_c0_g1~~TRINITY_DN19041_c0_g1_i4.p1  ORF type:complete len:125 (+),score=37.60 TRINITY_DN19041_c0_g1_i4:166-540(+)